MNYDLDPNFKIIQKLTKISQEMNSLEALLHTEEMNVTFWTNQGGKMSLDYLLDEQNIRKKAKKQLKNLKKEKNKIINKFPKEKRELIKNKIIRNLEHYTLRSL